MPNFSIVHEMQKRHTPDASRRLRRSARDGWASRAGFYLVPFPSEAWRASTKICNGLMRWILAPRQQLDPFNMESTPRALCQTRRVGLSGCLCTAAHGAPDSRRTRGRAYLVMRQTLPFCMQGSLLLFSMDTHNRRMICAHENTS